MTALAEAVMAAAMPVLASALPGVTVERARRAEVAITEMPRLGYRLLAMVPDTSQSPTETFWTLRIGLTGYAAAATDQAAETALIEMHAATMAAIEGRQFAPGVVDVAGVGMSIALYEGADRPCGEFNGEITVLAVAPTAYPYAP